jgi:hypothetical protein
VARRNYNFGILELAVAVLHRERNRARIIRCRLAQLGVHQFDDVLGLLKKGDHWRTGLEFKMCHRAGVKLTSILSPDTSFAQGVELRNSTDAGSGRSETSDAVVRPISCRACPGVKPIYAFWK